MKKLKIIWSSQATIQVENIFHYYKIKSEQGALNVVKAILESPESIKYPEQYQIDEINQNYRRIVVRGTFKVLYQSKGQIISIVAVIGTGQSPEKIKKYYPNGNTKNFVNPSDDSPSFQSYEISLP